MAITIDTIQFPGSDNDYNFNAQMLCTTTLASNTDLNTLTTVGKMYRTNDNDGTYINTPVTDPAMTNFGITVLPLNGTYACQLLTKYSSGEIYVRSQYYNGSTKSTVWGSWQKYLREGDSISNATNDSDGNQINTTYLKISGDNGTANTTNALLNDLSEGTSDPVDSDYYIAQYVGGGTTTTTYHRRPVSKLWNYIKSKIESVLGLTSTNYSGTAATAKIATTATTATTATHITVGDYPDKEKGAIWVS